MNDPKVPSNDEKSTSNTFDFDQLESRLDKLIHPNLIDVILDNIQKNIAAVNKSYRFTNRRIYKSTETNLLVYIEKCEDVFIAIHNTSPSFKADTFFKGVSEGIAALMCPDEGTERDAVKYCVHCALRDAYKEN